MQHFHLQKIFLFEKCYIESTTRAINYSVSIIKNFSSCLTQTCAPALESSPMQEVATTANKLFYAAFNILRALTFRPGVQK